MWLCGCSLLSHCWAISNLGFSINATLSLSHLFFSKSEIIPVWIYSKENHQRDLAALPRTLCTNAHVGCSQHFSRWIPWVMLVVVGYCCFSDCWAEELFKAGGRGLGHGAQCVPLHNSGTGMQTLHDPQMSILVLSTQAQQYRIDNAHIEACSQ